VARAARISLAALSVVAAGGFVVRLGVIVAIMFWLNEFAFFSPLAFGLAVVPATIALLGFEMRLIASGVGTQLQVSSEDVKGDVVR
jgi:cytochrome c biogenesis factor